MTAQEAYDRTLERQDFLERQGYRVRVAWECDVQRDLRRNRGMKEYYATIDINGAYFFSLFVCLMVMHYILCADPMDSREAFYGGRTNAVKLYHQVAEGEKIMYKYVCSLYPWVCKYGSFPLGHPEVITENFKVVAKCRHPYNGMFICFFSQTKHTYVHFLRPYQVHSPAPWESVPSCAASQVQWKVDVPTVSHLCTGWSADRGV
jgi:hypothetical protein